MTIRIHEADGTPYEHIIEIKDSKTTFDIPYNTKYKRLKRSRRQKERTAANVGNEYVGGGNDDILLYSLGDVLQSEEEMKEWRLAEWSKDDEEKMSLDATIYVGFSTTTRQRCCSSAGGKLIHADKRCGF